MVGQTSVRNINLNFKRNCVARALYDNVAESPDELAFCKGDLLTVLEQNTGGLEGWWLCSLRGRQGICPGNRLRIVPGCYDDGSGLNSLGGSNMPPQKVVSGPVPSQLLNAPKKVITPKRIGDVFAYDSPTGTPPIANYDVPPQPRSTDKRLGSGGSRLSRSSSLRYDAPRPASRGSQGCSLEQYDSPRPVECSYDAPNSKPVYDSPKFPPVHEPHYNTPRFGDVTDAPRSLIKGVRGGISSTNGGKGPSLNQNESSVAGICQQEYDVPRPSFFSLGRVEAPLAPPSDRSSNISLMSCDSHLSSSSSASSLQASESLSLSSVGGGSSNRSSLEGPHDIYDIPPEPRLCLPLQKPALPPREHRDEHSNKNSLMEAVYDVPPQVCRDARTSDKLVVLFNRMSSGSDSSEPDLDVMNLKELPLEVDSAIDTLHVLEQETLASCAKISSLKTSQNRLDDTETMKTCISHLMQTVTKLLNFIQGSVGNAFKAGEHKLAKRISRLVDPIKTARVVISDSNKKLQTLCSSDIPSGISHKTICREEFGQVSSITTSLSENARHLVSVVQLNAHLIFKKRTGAKKTEDDEKTPVQERPLPDIPPAGNLTDNMTRKYTGELIENSPRRLLEDYDYVNIESKELAEREHKEILNSLPTQLRHSFDTLIKQSTLTVDSDHRKAMEYDNLDISPLTTPTNNPTNRTFNRLDSNERQILSFYSKQVHSHMENLNSAIEAFLLTVENNQPPKVFIAHSKFVILSAHKLVFIGDTIHRNVSNTEIRTRVLNCTNALCDAMKNTVEAAKTAAIRFPSVAAVQTMVDAFVAVSHLSNNLKKAIY